MAIKLNLGSGFHRLGAEYINVDRERSVNPDVLWDLENFPYPWKSESIDEVIINHTLEHLSPYKQVMQELYRICKPGALIHITVPWVFHINQWSDPTHVRAITPLGLQLLSRNLNERWIKGGYSNSPLAIYWGIDFDLISIFYVSDEAMWQKTFPALWRDDIHNQQILKENSNINGLISEMHAELTVVKNKI
jgi:SAM-dependent methyltransferase